MNIQTETAINIFNDIYGYPKWQKETKDGQSYDEIIKLWDGELKGYTVQQIKTACYHIIKYRKNMTYPTLSHLLAELVDEEKEENKGDELQRVIKALESKTGTPTGLLAVQRTLWQLYQYRYQGYEPEKDEETK